jgi:transcriptional regulator with XRE-family HTH domain
MFGERLRFLREEKEFTQQQIAEAIGSTQQKISNYENETVEPDCQTLVKLADFFETTVDFILGRTKQRAGIGMYAALNELPVEAVKEAETFLEFVKYKYRK